MTPTAVLNELNKDAEQVANAKKYKEMIEKTEIDQSSLLDELVEAEKFDGDIAADVERILQAYRSR